MDVGIHEPTITSGVISAQHCRDPFFCISELQLREVQVWLSSLCTEPRAVQQEVH